MRKNLYHSTPYNEPKVLFDKYEDAKDKYELNQEVSEDKKEEICGKEDENFKAESAKMIE